jgi:hypothetical protein
MPTYLPRFSRVALGSLFALALTVSMTSVANGQDNLLGVLRKKYPLTQITTTGEIANPGVVMTLQANGINAEPYPTMITFENPVVDGAVQQRSKFTGLIKSTNLHILHPGDRVYITKLNAKTDDKNNDYLKLTILTCDPVDVFYANAGGATLKRLSTTLSFKQPKGSLAEMSPDDASRMIEAIMSQDNGGGQGQQGQQAPPPQRQAAGAAPVAAPVPASDSSAPPPTIAMGQTISQVVAIMGQPKQIIDLGSKKTYKYADLKVVFLNGKVSDVE